jgi:hypothetical protein
MSDDNRLDNAAGRWIDQRALEVVSASGVFNRDDRLELEAELRKHYTDLHKAGQWTEDWDAYTEIGMRGDLRDYTRSTYHDVFQQCVPAFLRAHLGWYAGSKNGRYKARPWIRYWAFSGDWSSRPNRVVLARSLERLHWLAQLDPPTWAQVRNREECVRQIEGIKARQGRYTTTSGGGFWPDAWGHGSPAPDCPQCARAGRRCGPRRLGE